MVRIIFNFIILLCVLSCSVDSQTNSEESSAMDTASNTYDEFLPVTDVLIPQTIKIGEPSDIFVYYTIPSTCHTFKDVFYNVNGYERTVAIVSQVQKQDTCITDSIRTEKTSFKFKVDKKGAYQIKFWNGKDKKGNVEYITYDVIVGL